ncbi:MAG: hypothetical protein ABI867_07860 [Kofleriaceae bacterium]
MRMVFCSVACWDAHLGEARHRDAGAIEAWAPTKEQWQRELASSPEPEPKRPAAVVTSRPAPAPAVLTRPPQPQPAVQQRGPAPTPDSVQPRPASMAPAPAPAPTPAPVRTVVSSTPTPFAATGDVALADIVDRDILIVVSKLKKYIKDRSGFNCSDAIVDVLSDHVRVICDDSIRAAARDERKTVLERDIPRPRLSSR